MSIGAQRAVQKMRSGTMGGQARVAQPTAFPRGRLQQKKKAVSRGLRAHYDGSDEDTYFPLDANLRIDHLYDKSGTQRHLIAPPNAWFNSTPLAVDACRPLWTPNAQNGLSGITFSRHSSVADDCLYRRDKSAFNFMHTGPTTVFLVYKPTDTTGGGATPTTIGTTYFNSGTWPNGDQGYQLWYSPNQFTGLLSHILQVINASQGGNETAVSVGGDWAFPHNPPQWWLLTVITRPTLPNLPLGFGVTHNPDRGHIYVNGADDPFYNTATGVITTRESAGFFGLGGCVAATYNGAIPAADTTVIGSGRFIFGEALIYEGELQGPEWRDIRSELNDKWAIY